MSSRPEAFVRQLSRRFLDAVARGDAAAASAAVAEAVRRQIGLAGIYLDVITPALEQVGQLWACGQLSVAQEHLATQITLAEMARLRELTGPSRRTGLSAVVSAVEGEQHFMGARMVADLLEQEGWAVDFLGPNTPGPDLIALVAGRRPVDLLVVSVTMDQLLTSVRQLSDGIRALLSPPKIMVGGLAARGRPDLAASLEVDYVASDAADAVAAAAALVASSAAPNPPHEWLLQTIGRNVLELRKRRGWSQQELAAAAGLDRTYISGVERGRQNLTVGSLLSLAQALESPFGDLLVTEPARA